MAKEYIEREALAEAIRKDYQPISFSMVCRHIDKAPAADVVEVVRCEDCKYWARIEEFKDGLCNNPFGLDDVAQPDDFCSYGKRGYGSETD